MRHYQHIFFDLDHTLWDFETNSKQTLEELFEEFQLSKFSITKPFFLQAFSVVNSEVWSAFNEGSMDKETLRRVRFPRVFRKLNLAGKAVPPGLEDAYLANCPAKGGLMPGATEVLNYLDGDYQLHILTNGFKGIQDVKMRSGKIDHFFDQVITAECTGARKPQREIFLHALERTGAKAGNSLMIGDNLYCDILGAKGLPMDQVFYNPFETVHSEEVQREITHLEQLKNWL